MTATPTLINERKGTEVVLNAKPDGQFEGGPKSFSKRHPKKQRRKFLLICLLQAARLRECKRLWRFSQMSNPSPASIPVRCRG